jgi:hypothetical protein
MKIEKKYVKKAAVGLILCSVLILSFAMYQMGAYNMCMKSDGVLLGDGHCVNYSSLNYCLGEYDDQIKSYADNAKEFNLKIDND